MQSTKLPLLQPGGAAFLVLLVVLIPVFAVAQKQWNIELRPSINFPVHTIHGNKNIGFGIEGKAIRTLLPGTGAYVGWGWNLFPAETKSTFSYEETGFTYGLQYAHGKSEARVRYFAGVGGVYNTISTERSDLNEKDESGYKLGWQIESGIEFQISPKLLVRPGLRYRTVSAGKLRYFSFGAGFLF